jgi:dipeptidyl aminopeptidase/acylaminoacyl peptidase
MSVPLRLACLVIAVASLAPAPALRAEPLDVTLSDQVDRRADEPFRVGGGGSRVAFQTATDVLSVPIEGGGAATLTPPGVEATDLVDLRPDGERALLTANEPGSLAWLFSAPLEGGETVRLHAPLAADVRAFPGPLTPDGSRVVYGTGSFDGVEVFVVPLAGGASVPLTLPDRPLDARSALLDLFAISPDGTLGVSALYERLDPDDNFDPDPVLLFSTALDGGPATVLHEGMWFDDPLVITSDSERVVYSRAGELFSTSVGGGVPARLSPDLPLPANPQRFSVTSDDALVIYDDDVERGFNDVYAVPMAGGSRTRLSHPDGLVDAFPWILAPDGKHVVFAQPLGPLPALEDQLFSVPVQGGEPTPLSPPILLSIQFRGIAGIRVSRDGDRVLYAAEQDSAELMDVYAVPIEGGPVTRLGGPIARNGTNGLNDTLARFQLTPDETRVVLLVDATDDSFDGPFELYAVPIDGGATTKLNAPLAANERIFPSSIEITPDGRHVVFLVTRPGPGPVDLHSARLPPDVRIDVLPRRADNKLPHGRHATIPVAILGSADLDVAEVELATLAFGPDGAAPQRKAKRIDVDGDGFRDLVTRYRRAETGIERGDTEACLAGRVEGFEFESCDAVVSLVR